jgi:3-deoxy-D-manno-octulosonic-acid transferase
MRLIYDIILTFYHLGIFLLALVHPKAKAWVHGRRGQWLRIRRDMETVPAHIPVVWMHCASAGEFEQGRPILEKLRELPCPPFVVLTFYSPSGYELRCHTPLADQVYYLPPDGQRRAERFLELVRPQLAIFVKYEFWHHYLSAMRKKGTAHWLVAGLFTPDQRFFRPWGRFFRNDLSGFSRLFVQDESSAALLQRYGLTEIHLVGDPRVDRVWQIRETPFEDPVVEAFSEGSPLGIWGSTWEKDERMLWELLRKSPNAVGNRRILLVPHEPTPPNVQRLLRWFSDWGARRYSEGVPPADCRVLIIDRIGMLSRLYRYADLAYVGGGFNRGIHNILEPAAYGLPILFGPRFEKFVEARALLASGGAFCTVSTDVLGETIARLDVNPNQRAMAGLACRTYLEKSRGASDKIVAEALQLLNYACSGDATDERTT